MVALLIVLGPHLAIATPRPESAEPEQVAIQMPSILIPPAPFEEPVPELEERNIPENPDAKKASKTYIRTTQNDPEDNAPSNSRFESDRNTTAAAEQSATSELDLPSQQGIDLPFIELETRDYVDGDLADDRTAGDDAPESLADNTPPSPPVTIEPLPPILTPEENPPSNTDGQLTEKPQDPSTGITEIAKLSPPPTTELLQDFPSDPDTPDTIPLPDLPMSPDPPEETVDLLEPGEISLEEPGDLKRTEQQPVAEARPVPPPRPPSDPKPKPGDPNANEKDVFQPHTRTTHFEGGINRKGRSAVDAASTPLGKYGRAVTGAIEKKWHLYRIQHADFLTYATMKLQFQVDASGKVRNLKILDNDANAIMTDFTLSAILEAPLPTIPQDVLELLDDGRFNITYNVVVY
ncbi:MAG: hypothetical protein P8J87_11855 [Verrucomicrobiales bacterium]|nr:hypothetical protein [Verrucomicrobiales bacterium]